jgi:cytochrome bd ubiquinol oxidase subunit I
MLRLRRRLYDSPALARVAVALGPAGFVAVLAGWITTEVGRQPYTVYGLLRTADSVSPIEAPAVAASLAGFVVVYLLVFGAGVFYLLRLMRQNPAEVVIGEPPSAKEFVGAGLSLGAARRPSRREASRHGNEEEAP